MAILDSSHVHRYAFPSFDAKEEPAPVAPPPEPQKAEPPPPPGPLPLPLQLPAITEKDLQAARAEAQAMGYREGYAAAQGKFNKEAAAREEAMKSLLEIVANRITIAAEAHANEMREREALMQKLIVACARKIAGDALKREPYAAVEALLRQCIALIAGEPTVTVVVSNTLASGLKQRIDTLKPLLQGFSGEITVKEDFGLLDQDCRVEWTSGYGERSTEDLWNAIEAIVMKTNMN